MSFVNRELERISVALGEPRSAEQNAQLYAAQQALSWALEPTGFKAPFQMIMSTAEGSEDCPSMSSPHSF